MTMDNELYIIMYLCNVLELSMYMNVYSCDLLTFTSSFSNFGDQSLQRRGRYYALHFGHNLHNKIKIK